MGIKIKPLALLFLLLTIRSVDAEYVIDFSSGFEMETFAQSKVPLATPTSVAEKSNRRSLPNDARYVFKLPSSNTFIFDAHMGHVAVAYKNEGNAGRLVLYGNKPQYYLTAEEALTILEQFHKTFKIPKDQLYEWFESVNEGLGGRGYYQAIAKNNYPEIALEVANSFFEEKPVFLVFYLDFDEETLRKRGVSAERNTVSNLTFDVPAIIDLVRSQTAVTEIPLDTPSNEVKETAEEVAVYEPATEDPAEAKTPDTPEEPTEQPSQWWLWLIGAVVAVVLVLVIRRRS